MTFLLDWRVCGDQLGSCCGPEAVMKSVPRLLLHMRRGLRGLQISAGQESNKVVVGPIYQTLSQALGAQLCLAHEHLSLGGRDGVLHAPSMCWPPKGTRLHVVSLDTRREEVHITCAAMEKGRNQGSLPLWVRVRVLRRVLVYSSPVREDKEIVLLAKG